MRLSAEQKAVIEPGFNLAVNAGAGSGKTTVLTARYLRLLEEGFHPGEIVAITYTNKAAREIRERIGAEVAALTPANRRWQEVKEQLATAPIGTIHSFYSRVLRQFPLEAEVGSSFAVLDEAQSEGILNHAVALTFQEAAAEGCPHLGRMIEIMGIQALEEDGSLAGQVRTLYCTLRNKGIPIEEATLARKYGDMPDWRSYQDRLRELLAVETEASFADAPEEIKEARKTIVLVVESLADISCNEDLLPIYPLLIEAAGLKAGRLKRYKEFIQSAVGEVQSLLSRGVAPLLGQAIIGLLTRLDGVYKNMKERIGSLDFADLQFAMWRLLASPGVRELLRSKYKTYMIDEFQDTDLLQHKVLWALLEEKGGIPPGRLFVVGDENQSIYRFRGAEIKVFQEVRRELAASGPGGERNITCNFRSRRPLIDFVNDLFCRLATKGGMNYYPLSAIRSGEAPCVELIYCQRQKGEPALGEAKALAAAIKGMVGSTLVGDLANPRRARYKDMVILLRSRTHIAEYQHQLRLAGIPYRTVGGTGFFQRPEVRDLINLLRVIENRGDELSLVALLRSPLFSLDDDSLLALAGQGKTGTSLLEREGVLSGEQERRFLRAKNIISELRGNRGFITTWELLALALDLTQYREAVLAGFNGLQGYANLAKFLSLAEEFQVTSPDEDFISWLEQAAAYPEEEAPIDSEEDDSVRLMTIHGSKGLQFPIVLLPLANSKMRFSPGNMIVDENGELALRFPWLCPVWEAAKEGERQKELEEYQRLLYVAVTRAEDRLAFVVAPADEEEESFNSWILQLYSQVPAHFSTTSAELVGENITFPLPLPEPSPGEGKGGEKFFPGLRGVSSSISPIRYYSISQFLLWWHDREQFDRRYISPLVYPDSLDLEAQVVEQTEEPGGREFGSLLHRALEEIHEATDVDAYLDDRIGTFFPGVEGELRERIHSHARQLLKGYMQDPGPPSSFSAAYREQGFYYRLGDALFYGVVDRLLVGAELTVVDYKTNSIPPLGVGELLKFYGPQLGFYGMAMRDIYHLPVRTYLQFLRLPPGQQAIEVKFTSEELEDLRTRLQEFVCYCQNKS